MSTQATAGRYVPQWTTGDRLRRVRRDTGLTQSGFAERLGVGTQRYSAWEGGRNQPPLEEFVTVAKRIELAFGVPVSWTLGLDDGSGGPGGSDQGTMEGNMVRYSTRTARPSPLTGLLDRIGDAA